MLNLLNIYLLSLNLRTISPMIWDSIKNQLTYPEFKLKIPMWQWLIEQTTTTKKQYYLSIPNNSFEHWINTNLHSVPLVTYFLTDQQAKDIISFLRKNQEHLD